MKRILLVCAAGLSTTLLVNNMKAYALGIGKEVHIEALPISKVAKAIEQFDIVMLGPQVRYQLPQVEAMAKGMIPVIVLDMREFGMVDAKAVLTKAYDVMNK